MVNMNAKLWWIVLLFIQISRLSWSRFCFSPVNDRWKHIQTCLRLEKITAALMSMYKLIDLPEVRAWTAVSFLLLIAITFFKLLSKFKRNWIFMSQGEFHLAKVFQKQEAYLSDKRFIVIVNLLLVLRFWRLSLGQVCCWWLRLRLGSESLRSLSGRRTVGWRLSWFLLIIILIRIICGIKRFS
jgi:hypothetical protein